MFPAPAIMVSCSFEGEDNIITLAWASKMCMTPPKMAIAINQARHSYRMIKESGEFVINLPFNPVNNTILPVKEMVNSRMYFGAAALNGKIYVMGGYTTTSLSDFIAHVEAYDPSSNAWISRKPLPKARHNMAVCVHSNNIYVLGGAENYYDDHLGQTSSVLKYYP